MLCRVRLYSWRLIGSVVESSVDGAVDLDYARSGVTRRLTCPAVIALGLNGDTQANMGALIN
jgi:hypothetical protein